jgi:hypothetical protein
MRAMASVEARETTRWMGVVSCSGFCGLSVGTWLEARGRTYAGQELDAVPLDAVDAARLVQLLHGDGFRGIQAALVNPRLDAVEVDGRHLDLEAVRISAMLLCYSAACRVPLTDCASPALAPDW